MSTDGHIKVSAARLYVTPARPPMLLAAALSPATARWAASWAGLITVAGSRTNIKAVVDAFRESGGADKPMFLQVSLSYAPSDDEAVRCAYEQWRHCALDSDALANLSTPAEFECAIQWGEMTCSVTIRTAAHSCRRPPWPTTRSTGRVREEPLSSSEITGEIDAADTRGASSDTSLRLRGRCGSDRRQRQS
jgi:alkanesulfonate monooxygenase SsuD/methylene tetrahydromethanopterin reductase-like flavin-dependent oxidoreductase (luciferase family)